MFYYVGALEFSDTPVHALSIQKGMEAILQSSHVRVLPDALDEVDY